VSRLLNTAKKAELELMIVNWSSVRGLRTLGVDRAGRKSMPKRKDSVDEGREVCQGGSLSG
jgi:hypothetical protein